MKHSFFFFLLILFSTFAYSQDCDTVKVDSSSIQTEQQITNVVQKLEVQNAQLKLERIEIEKRLAELNETIPKNEAYLQGLKDSAGLLKQNRDKLKPITLKGD